MKRALLIVDALVDFFPGGALPIPDGHLIVPVINRAMDLSQFDLVIAVNDFHPLENSYDWPKHCIQGTPGAAFHPDLDTRKITKVFHKGTDPDVHPYGGFFEDNDRQVESGLGAYLDEQGVSTVWIVGLATDWCVKVTALDGVFLGFRVGLITDGVRGLDLNPGDVDAAIVEMKEAGVMLLSLDDFEREITA